MRKRSIVLFPILLSIAFVCGMLINRWMTPRQGVQSLSQYIQQRGGLSKLDMVLNMLNVSYVDTVDTHQLEEDAIVDLIKNLDPHTVYIPAKDMAKVDEEMMGNFGGIGVQFYKYKDTVTVVKVVPGGPSESAGIMDGDRIIKVDTVVVAGVNMNTDSIMSHMRGIVGTDVTLKLVRRGTAGTIDKKIVRGNIPIKSVPVAYMLNDTTGYIMVNLFAMTTYQEFMEGLQQLKAKGMKRLVVDLRENRGGILPIAIQMCNEFLEKDRLIVYTEGKAVKRMDYRANGNGQFKELPLVVLINEFSASASEIFAGAIQDNDRGLVVGRRSFGKGLVQDQRPFSDGSAIRLTIARYYIPSGRCIQKPYNKGADDYNSDIYKRLLHGEFSERDSIKIDKSMAYKTTKGRLVYGGGGVMPDIFVPADTVGYSKYLGDLISKQYLYEYTFDFMDAHRAETKHLKNVAEIEAYLSKFDLVNGVVAYAEKRGLKPNWKEINESKNIIFTRTEAFIGRHILDDAGFYPIYGKEDITLKKALASSFVVEGVE